MMDNNSFTVWGDSLVPFMASQGDPASISASLILIDPSGDLTTHTASYELVDGKMVADLSFTAPDVEEETVYDYYAMENFTSEPSLIYPDPTNCMNGECELPTMTVCVLGGNES